MLVSADSGSIYQPKPLLRWSTEPFRQGGADGLTDGVQQMSLGGEAGGMVEVEAEKIYNFHALHGGNSFWRFKFEIPMQPHEQVIHYNINVGLQVCYVSSKTHVERCIEFLAQHLPHRRSEQQLPLGGSLMQRFLIWCQG